MFYQLYTYCCITNIFTLVNASLIWLGKPRGKDSSIFSWMLINTTTTTTNAIWLWSSCKRISLFCFELKRKLNLILFPLCKQKKIKTIWIASLCLLGPATSGRQHCWRTCQRSNIKIHYSRTADQGSRVRGRSPGRRTFHSVCSDQWGDRNPANPCCLIR